jgi:hypothetical protein
MELFLVAAWLLVAALVLGPPLLGRHRSTWPLRRDASGGAGRSGSDPDGTGDEDAGTRTERPVQPPTPVGRCRACGAGGQSEYTYCRVCLTPLPSPAAGADEGRGDGHPAD